MRIFTFLLLLVGLLTAGNSTLSAAFIVATPDTDASQTDTTEAIRAEVAAYKAELATLSRKERRALKRQQRKEIKQTLKEYKQAKKEGKEPSTNTLLLAIVAILLPPLAVFLYTEEIGTKFWISVVLTLLLWLPGIIYALLVITDNAKK